MKNLTVMLIAAAALAGCTGKKTADVQQGSEDLQSNAVTE